MEGVKHAQIIDISLFFCISVWSIGDGAPEETEKRDDSQRSTLFIEKPQSGSVSVGKCLETKLKATSRETETEKRYVHVRQHSSFCPQLQILPLILAGCEVHSLKAKQNLKSEAKINK